MLTIFEYHLVVLEPKVSKKTNLIKGGNLYE